MDPLRLEYLFHHYFDKTCSEVEKAEFLDLLRSEDARVNEQMKNLIGSMLAENKNLLEMNEVSADAALTTILLAGKNDPAIIRHISPWKKIIRSAAAAVLIFGLGTASWYLLFHKSPAEMAKTEKPIQLRDVTPGVTRATLTLANGNRILIDSARSGQLATQGQTNIINQDGRLTYQGNEGITMLYNTLSTGRGEQSSPLTLSDGTKVWLNAASSIRFPVAFTGKTRAVEISGEAYFEVAKNPSKPFMVKAGQSITEVLGTHFDIMSYSDEPFMFTTLIEGSVKITFKDKQKILKPGQQSSIGASAGDLTIREADTLQTLAWMHGQLPMNHMDVRTFMRQVSRWYNVDVKYEGTLPDLSFSGSINKNVNLSYVLTALESNGIHTNLEGKTVTISAR